MLRNSVSSDENCIFYLVSIAKFWKAKSAYISYLHLSPALGRLYKLAVAWRDRKDSVAHCLFVILPHASFMLLINHKGSGWMLNLYEFCRKAPFQRLFTCALYCFLTDLADFCQLILQKTHTIALRFRRLRAVYFLFEISRMWSWWLISSSLLNKEDSI